MSLQCLSTINMVFSDEDKILIKGLYLKEYTAKRLTDNFLRKALHDTGTVDKRPEIRIFNFTR